MTPSTEDLLASIGSLVLPLDYDAETSVLSCLLQRPQLCDELPAAPLFHHPVSKMVFTGITAVIASKLPLDPVTLTRVLRDANVLDKCGGAYYISSLLTGGESAAMVGHYAHYLAIITEKFRMRQMIGALAAGIAHLQAFTEVDGISATNALEHCQKLVCEAVNDDGSSDMDFKPMSELMADVIDQIEERVKNPGNLPGITTGFAKLDEFTGGLERGTLTVIAGKPSDGKSILARQICENACMNGYAASIYSVEMTPLQESNRLLCSQAMIDAQNMKMGIMSRGEMMAIGAKIPQISKWDMQIKDAAGSTIERICRDIARRSKKLKPGQELVAEIDYLQICTTSEKDVGNREQEVSHIAKTAKLCAKTTGARIIFPCQLNKQGEARESEAIEQHADNFYIIMDHVADDEPKKKPWEKSEPKEESEHDFADLFLKKVRNGIRRVKVNFRRTGRFFRFEPHTHEKS
jgi:replicative DNA helicase